jgi:eukaryotic-like serine/threonine-protein kinase
MRRLISEIHRRSLWQVLGVYLLGSWLGYEVILALWEGLGLPSWVPPLAIVLFIIGLPIVLATAIVQEGHPLQTRDGDDGSSADRVDGLQTAADALTPEAARGDGPIPSAATPAAAEERPSPPPSFLAGVLTWNRAIRAGVLAFALLGVAATGFLGMRELGIGPAATLVSSGALGERPVVVLSDFTADDDATAEVVTEALRIDLHQSTAMKLADAAYLADVLRRMERDPSEPLTQAIAREVAEREALDAVITGEVRELGGRYVLAARVEDSDGGVLAALRADAADEASLLEAVDLLSTRIREKVGESLRSVRRSEPLEAVSTSSLEALRLYSRAVKLADRTGDNLRAAELFARAVEVDSTFAMSWRKLGVTIGNSGGDQNRQFDAYRRAFDLRARLPEQERYLAEGSYYRYVVGDREAALQAYRTLLELNPDHTPALNNLAIIETDRGRPEEAARLMRRAAHLEPTALHYSNLALNELDLGNLDAADSAIAAGLERSPGHLNLLMSAAAVAYARGDYAAVEAAADRLEAAHPDGWGAVTAEFIRGIVHGARGRYRAGAEHVVAAADRARRYGLPDGVVRAKGLLARVPLYTRGDSAETARRVEAAITDAEILSFGPRQREHDWFAAQLAQAGRPDRAEAVLEASRRDHEEAGILISETAHAYARAAIARARGNYDDALRELRLAEETGGDGAAVALERAFVHEAAGRPAAAVAAYEQALGMTGVMRMPFDFVYLGFILQRVGELLEAQGETARALEYYARFTELWADADPELQPRVESVRRRMAALSGEARGTR